MAIYDWTSRRRPGARATKTPDNPSPSGAPFTAPPEEDAKVEIVDRDDPESLLTSLIEQDEAHTENTRYILAIMLERKKILIETDSQKTRTGLLRIYEHRYSGEVFIVKDPQIPLSEVAPLQEEVQKLLSPDEETETLPGGECEDASTVSPAEQ